MSVLPITLQTGQNCLSTDAINITIINERQVSIYILLSKLYRQMAYRQQTYPRPNDTYNSIREQTDRDTQGIIQDRNSINVHRPSNTYVPTNRNIQNSQAKWQPDFSQKRSSYQVEISKKNEIKNRIKEIIDLCKDQNSAVNREMTGVIEAEKGVLNLLSQPEQQNYRHSAPVNHFTPIKPQENHQNNLQREFRSILAQNSHIQLSQQAYQLITQIERRALAEIQKLKAQNNYEKRKNSQLQKELSYYRNQGAPGGGYQNELKAKVAYLENLVQQQQKGFGGSGIDFNALYAQGEAIRQDTLRLLKLKEAKLNGGYEDQEKRQLRDQVQRLQRRIQQLQNERGGRVSKPSYQVINQVYSPIVPAHRRTNSNRNSANQYESLVMEMRKITAN